MKRSHNDLMLLYYLGETFRNESAKLIESPGAVDVKRLAKRCANWAVMLQEIAQFEEERRDEG